MPRAFAASVPGPDAVPGLSAGASLRLPRWLDAGAEATRLFRGLGEVRWLVTPTLRIRL